MFDHAESPMTEMPMATAGWNAALDLLPTATAPASAGEPDRQSVERISGIGLRRRAAEHHINKRKGKQKFRQ